MINKIKKLKSIRSPSLQLLGYYTCGNCRYSSPNSLLIVCADHDTLYCLRKFKNVKRWETCKKGVWR